MANAMVGQLPVLGYVWPLAAHIEADAFRDIEVLKVSTLADDLESVIGEAVDLAEVEVTHIRSALHEQLAGYLVRDPADRP